MKNVVKCWKDFFGYFIALETHSGRWLVSVGGLVCLKLIGLCFNKKYEMSISCQIHHPQEDTISSMY